MKIICFKVDIEHVEFGMIADLEQPNIELAHRSWESSCEETSSDSELERALKKLGQFESYNR